MKDGRFDEAMMAKTLKQVVVTLGDRKHSGFCVKCGTTLLEPYNDYHACSKCTDDIELAIAETKLKTNHYHKNLKSPLPVNEGRLVVQSSDILRQVRPIGVPVK